LTRHADGGGVFHGEQQDGEVELSITEWTRTLLQGRLRSRRRGTRRPGRVDAEVRRGAAKRTAAWSGLDGVALLAAGEEHGEATGSASQLSC
jgi:hypothetical protein